MLTSLLSAVFSHDQEIIDLIRYDHIKGLEAGLQEREQQISELTGAVRGKEEQIRYLKEQIADISRQLKEKEQLINELHGAVHGKDEQIQHLEGEITDFSAQLKEKEQLINELNGAVHGKDEQIQHLEGEITNFSSQLKEKERQIDELDVAVQGKDAQMRDFKGQIADISDQLDGKEQQINELNVAVHDKDARILNFEGQITSISGQLKDKEERIRDLDIAYLKRNTELNSIKSSVTWRIVMKWHSLVEWLMPPMTRRRRWYDLSIIGLRTITNEGWRHFWWKYKQHKSTKKLSGDNIENTSIIMKKSVNQNLLIQTKLALRPFFYFAMDTVDLLLGRRDKLTPPRRMISIGEGDFKKIGEEFLRYFIELGSLKPNETVLDVGCGIGRMAAPLTKYMDKNGSYEGFDIVKKDIDWCKKKISRRYYNFHFQLAHIYNKHYNPEGKYKAAEYTFPYKNKSYDFVFLTSVFTHMLPQEMENYISEIARVLKKDGRCLITFFLLNEESLKLIETKKSTLDFKYVFEEYHTIDKDTSEAAVAYEEQFIRRLCGKYGLKIKEPVYYGSWSGRKGFSSYQDIIIATRG
jgi:ubiquinone/menaquinone biosynthesis C-methylase UbiE/peptidoglycan hydrolase CwlO-like protein